MDTVNDTLSYWTKYVTRDEFSSMWPLTFSPLQSQLITSLTTLSRSQWFPPKVIEQQQLIQAMGLAHFAAEHTNYYADAFKYIDLKSITTMDAWRTLPILTRKDIQNYSESMLSKAFPAGEAPLDWLHTSGSSGEPLKVKTSVQAQYFYTIFFLRECEWQKRDFKQISGAIRYIKDKDAIKGKGWSKHIQDFIVSGPSCGLNIKFPPEVQLQWLNQEKPAYLLTYPSNLRALLNLIQENRATLPYLKEVRTFGEICNSALKELCYKVLNLHLVDMYTTQELGYVALQGPDNPSLLHVQSEGVLLEILHDDGSPCKEGEIGRVVITSLHNLAMPIIRYATGDLASFGPACSCGRGLPTLKEIVGRERHMVSLPNGSKTWPPLMPIFRDFPDILQFQIIQNSLTTMIFKLLTRNLLSPEQEYALKNAFNLAVGFNFEITIEYIDKIERAPSGKFHEFMSML